MVTPPCPQDLLDRFTPVVLSAAAWAWAGLAGVPAIRAVPGITDGFLISMASQVRWLLSRSGVWDQTSTPDLVAILTPRLIDEVTSKAQWRQWREFADLTRVAANGAGATADSPASTRATARAVLTRVVHRRRPDTALERIVYTPIQAPYTPSECAAFVHLARKRPTKDHRRALSALVALGRRAGLGTVITCARSHRWTSARCR